MEETVMPSVIDTAKGITDYGMAAVTAAAFIVLSTSLIITCFIWFKNSMGKMFATIGNVSQLIDDMSMITDVITPISDRAKWELRACVESFIDTSFELSVEKTCRMIKTIREQNHIANHEATRAKIYTLLRNQHEMRNVQFSSYFFRGKPLSEYCSDEWIEWVSAVIQNELYNTQGENNARAYGNVVAVFDRIKTDMLKRLQR